MLRHLVQRSISGIYHYQLHKNMMVIVAGKSFYSKDDAYLVGFCGKDAGMPYDCINAFDRCLLRLQQSHKKLGLSELMPFVSVEMVFIARIPSPSFFPLVKNPRNVRLLRGFARVLALQIFSFHILMKRLRNKVELL